MTATVLKELHSYKSNADQIEENVRKMNERLKDCIRPEKYDEITNRNRLIKDRCSVYRKRIAQAEDAVVRLDYQSISVMAGQLRIEAKRLMVLCNEQERALAGAFINDAICEENVSAIFQNASGETSHRSSHHIQDHEGMILSEGI